VLAFTSVGIPGELVTFWIHDQIAVVPRRLLDRLPEVAQQVHAVTVARVNQTLRAQGFPALRDSSPTSDRRLWGFGRRTAAPRPVSARRPAPVSPTARLDAISASSHGPLEQSL
jgi:hypothetical protein